LTESFREFKNIFEGTFGFALLNDGLYSRIACAFNRAFVVVGN
jgi:hypothetical protein